jgi:hypothetical protein
MAVGSDWLVGGPPFLSLSCGRGCSRCGGCEAVAVSCAPSRGRGRGWGSNFTGAVSSGVGAVASFEGGSPVTLGGGVTDDPRGGSKILYSFEVREPFGLDLLAIDMAPARARSLTARLTVALERPVLEAIDAMDGNDVMPILATRPRNESQTKKEDRVGNLDTRSTGTGTCDR